MRKYEPEYDESTCKKKKQIKLKRIDQLLRCPNHTKLSDYSLEFKLCVKIGCDLCPILPRVLHMHDEELTKEVNGSCTLPRLDVDGKTFLSIN